MSAESRLRWLVTLALAVIGLSAACLASAVSAAGTSVPPPGSMDALGDSFTQANYSGGSCASTVACPANSWSTGTTASVNSQYQRLLGLNPSLSGHEVNRAVAGRPMSYLDTEVQKAISDHPAYVTILMGINDVCGGSMTVSTMTPTSTFGSEFKTAMSDLTSHLPGVKVFVASIPNEYHLWQILHTNRTATAAWNSQTICPTMLHNPTSTAPADVSRRATVNQRIVSDNSELQQVCSQFTRCQFDNDAVYNWNFAPDDVDSTDYFHPSLQGQHDLAAVTYQNGYDFTSTGPASGYPAAVESDSPVSYWRFDETSGATAKDQESRNAGIYSGTHSLGAPGAIAGDTAVSFTGAGYVAVPHSTSLNTGDVFSLEAWIDPSRRGVNEGIFDDGSYDLYLNTLDQLVLYRLGAGEVATSTVTIPAANVWHHVVATKSGSAVHLYLDGNDVTGKVTARTVQNSTSTLMIGNGPTRFTGSLDEAAVYNHVLTPARVAAHYAAR